MVGVASLVFAPCFLQQHADVRDKVLELIDSWAQGLGGPSGPLPQYWSAGNELHVSFASPGL